MNICYGSEANTTLRLLGLLPMSGQGWIGGEAVLLPVKMALHDINNDPRILPGYNLTYNYIDSMCTEGVAVYRMFRELQAGQPYHMVLGDGCSTCSAATAQVSYLWNLTQLSYGSSSPILSDRKRFPKFFRIVTPEQKVNEARIQLMRKFDWNKVATIHQALEFFSVVTDDFVRRASDLNVTIITQEIFVHDPMSRVKNLKEHDARIIMTAMYEDRARAVLCAAYKVGLYGAKIVWVFAGWFSRTFWLVKQDDIDCTPEQMALVAEGAFFTSAVHFNPIEERGIHGMTVSEFLDRYYKDPDYNPDLEIYKVAFGQSYDHIWIAALALHCTDTELRRRGFAYCLSADTHALRQMLRSQCVSQ
ncbi:gamma-aminobutyric acid type B receptor subunit 1-like [Mya arenaria]|uniref:gamma-aminobutyric acid type B receptor subunit 1-like n=1 Tax=Mya arenaria TaxID=6604 RepID=UPI0022E4A355|nr:gamma-aminobutyric acid type B receptor subunit 1-like [Mya arenaria]